MKCPVCTEPDLIMTERQGVEIDYCPKCRGVWLDRGELDKIIERAAPGPAANPPPQSPMEYRSHPQGCSKHDGHHDEHGSYGQHRKKSWLSEMFD
jgi:Zn-finger nucleic acid-binding protein